ncbi:hypothetical protein RDWZM_000072 [Blomia tropicalis]|uniref:Uncharacterized protein n=1 Tax=Blomia tropicalis TaxID=40697 RepID=A0A9Q0M9F6_BLOTA|nr:hypothetical protein RDWZM_000072 [Blomia tropicalis]
MAQFGGRGFGGMRRGGFGEWVDLAEEVSVEWVDLVEEASVEWVEEVSVEWVDLAEEVLVEWGDSVEEDSVEWVDSAVEVFVANHQIMKLDG